MRRLSICLFALALIFAISCPPVQAQTGTTTWVANPLPMTQTTHPTLPELPAVYNTVSVLTFTATTTADTELTAVSGRKYLKFTVEPVSSSPAWLFVALGSTTATVNGANCVAVTATDSLEAYLDEYIPVAYIGNGSFTATVIQYGQSALRP